MKRYHTRGILYVLVLGILITGCGAPAPPTEPLPPPTQTLDPTQEIVETPPLILESSTAVPDSPPLVFRNGLVITATGADPISNGAVVIENGLIIAVGPESSITVPEDALVIDLEGKTIMPGLIDARASDLLNRLEIEDGQISLVSLELYLRSFLKAGVTTVRATGWVWEEMQTIPELRAALETHGNTIPSVIIVGTAMAHSESSGYTKYYRDQLVGVGTVEEAQQVTRELIELGVHQVSFTMSTGPSLNEAPEERLPVLTSDQLMAIVETAHAQDKLVVGQAIFAEEALTSVNAGIDELLSWPTPIEPLPEELIQALVTHSVPVVSGFSVGGVVPQEGDLRRFLDAGGTLVYGTFAPNSSGTPVSEFRIMELNGMTPMEMIQSATTNAAQVLEMEDMIGTLEVGKQADIIVVDGNPLEDNFLAVIGNVVYVVKNGELVIQPE